MDIDLQHRVFPQAAGAVARARRRGAGRLASVVGSHRVAEDFRMSRETEIFLRICEVADQLAVSSRTVRRWIEDGQLRAHRFGRAVRIAVSDLQFFLDEHR